ncbi:hypothetical protein KCV04_g44, partial [Aureobasidium melanogenum]
MVRRESSRCSRASWLYPWQAHWKKNWPNDQTLLKAVKCKTKMEVVNMTGVEGKASGRGGCEDQPSRDQAYGSSSTKSKRLNRE